MVTVRSIVALAASRKWHIHQMDVFKKYDEQINRTKKVSDDPLVDQTMYQRLIGKLLYLQITRPDIAFSTQTLIQFLQQPKKSHMDAALRIVRYLKRQPGQGLLLSSGVDNLLTVFCDVDWASCPLTKRSKVKAFIFLLLDMVIEQNGRKQRFGSSWVQRAFSNGLTRIRI
ncbi:secreted RxLR effector protein 161-like [Solanum dulcamara]|uniref:secreted RxLR effector protein 161-like n=1 Tax=Solanum dulcamara TaxID=45834 RepID=UPI0024863F44|nr:secreted RxLR effector protein 161-like [Solanum dulcamara]